MIKFVRKGFTLVEIMIVILVIGILAAAFVYSSTEAITTAKATRIIANLHTVRNAVLQFYGDYPDIFESKAYANKKGIQNYLQANPEYKQVIKNYIDTGKNTDIRFQEGGYVKSDVLPVIEGCYGVADAGEKNTSGERYADNRFTWFVGYGLTKDEDKVGEKLRARAKSEGLLFSGRIPNYNKNKGEHDVVWLRVFGEWEKPTDE